MTDLTDLLHPLTALTLLGRSFRRQQETLITDCPCCGGHLFIVDRSFVCEGRSCAFSRGSSIDLLAQVKGSYFLALQLAAENEPYYADRLVSEAAAHASKRRLLEFGMEAERQNYAPDIERLNLKQEFSAVNNADPNAFGRGHWFLTSEQSDRLVLILAEMGVTPPPNLQGRAAAVAPFWGNLHTLSQLYVVAAGSRTMQVCDIEPFRCSWFGMAQMHPANDSIDVFPEYVDAMENEERFRLHEPNRFPTQAHVNPRTERPGLVFQDMRFHGSNRTWCKHLPGWSYVPGFETAVFVGEEHEAMDLCALLGYLLQAQLDDFHCFVDMCGAMKLGNRARAHLLALAHLMHDQAMAGILRKTLSRKLLERNDKGSIYACASGYEIENGGIIKKVTNFTLELKTCTSFSEFSEMYFAGQAYIGSLVLDFELPSRKLDNPGQLVDALQNLQTLRPGGTQTGEPMAVIHSSKDFRQVMEIIRSQATLLPRSRGVRNLGWTRKHDAFLMPAVVVDPAGIHGGVRYHADEEGEHHCYESGKLEPEVLGPMPVLDPYLAEFISALIAQIFRYYHGLSVVPVPLQNNAETRARGLQIFRGLGQVAPLRLTNNHPRNIEINRGMPCLISGLNDLQREKTKLAGAWLLDRGLDLKKFPEAEIELASSILPPLIQEACRRLLSGEGIKFVEKRSVRPVSAMAEEGAALIRHEFWPAWPQAGASLVAIDRLLETREKEFVKQTRVNVAANTVTVPAAVWRDLPVDADDLGIDFGLLCASVDISDTAITVDRTSMYKLLGDFYGDIPRLQPA